MTEDLRRAIARAAWEQAVWNNFWWITIGGAALALAVACLVTPGA